VRVFWPQVHGRRKRILEWVGIAEGVHVGQGRTCGYRPTPRAAEAASALSAPAVEIASAAAFAIVKAFTVDVAVSAFAVALAVSAIVVVAAVAFTKPLSALALVNLWLTWHRLWSRTLLAARRREHAAQALDSL
jgi:hypothetical protein